MGLDALGGTIKGTFGTAFSEWGKKLLETFQQNLIQSGMGQLFGAPIDAAFGVFLIAATDFMLMDIYGMIKAQRKYNSTSMQTRSSDCKS